MGAHEAAAPVCGAADRALIHGCDGIQRRHVTCQRARVWHDPARTMGGAKSVTCQRACVCHDPAQATDGAKSATCQGTDV